MLIGVSERDERKNQRDEDAYRKALVCVCVCVCAVRGCGCGHPFRGKMWVWLNYMRYYGGWVGRRRRRVAHY